MNINKNIENKLKELFPNNWKNMVLDHYNHISKIDNLTNIDEKQKNKIKKNIFVKLLRTIDIEEKEIQYEQDILKRIIPKNKLKGGVTYIGTGCKLSRGTKEATWDEKKQIFIYTRYKHGGYMLDKMEHFADVVDTVFAGFTPLKEK